MAFAFQYPRNWTFLSIGSRLASSYVLLHHCMRFELSQSWCHSGTCCACRILCQLPIVWGIRLLIRRQGTIKLVFDWYCFFSRLLEFRQFRSLCGLWQTWSVLVIVRPALGDFQLIACGVRPASHCLPDSPSPNAELHRGLERVALPAAALLIFNFSLLKPHRYTLHKATATSARAKVNAAPVECGVWSRN